jgi:hypothetical protein
MSDEYELCFAGVLTSTWPLPCGLRPLPDTLLLPLLFLRYEGTPKVASLPSECSPFRLLDRPIRFSNSFSAPCFTARG